MKPRTIRKIRCVPDPINEHPGYYADPDAARVVSGTRSGFSPWRSLTLQAGNRALHGFGMLFAVEGITGRWTGCAGS